MFDFRKIFDFLEVGMTVASGVQDYMATQSATEQNLLNQQALVKNQRARAEADAYNQQLALDNAKLVQEQTQASLEKADRERRLRAGANIASAGGSGVGIGSVMDTLADNARQEELNLLTIEKEGILKQEQYSQQADLLGMSSANATQQANIAQSQMPYIKESGKRSGAASVLGSVSKGLSLWG